MAGAAVGPTTQPNIRPGAVFKYFFGGEQGKLLVHHTTRNLLVQARAVALLSQRRVPTSQASEALQARCTAANVQGRGEGQACRTCAEVARLDHAEALEFLTKLTRRGGKGRTEGFGGKGGVFSREGMDGDGLAGRGRCWPLDKCGGADDGDMEQLSNGCQGGGRWCMIIPRARGHNSDRPTWEARTRARPRS